MADQEDPDNHIFPAGHAYEAAPQAPAGEPGPLSTDPPVESTPEHVGEDQASESPSEYGGDGRISSFFGTIKRHPGAVAVVIVLLVGALLGANISRLSGTHSSQDSPTGQTSALGQSATTTTLPTTSQTILVPVVAPRTAAASGAATPTTPANTPATTATTAAPGPCTVSDLTLSTTTDANSYASGAPVTATTKIVDNVACVFTPVPGGPYSCPTTIVFINSNANQVYPTKGQAEQCAGVAGGTLLPGATRTVTVIWPEQASAGEYAAEGTWSWDSGTATPHRSDTYAIFNVT